MSSMVPTLSTAKAYEPRSHVNASPSRVPGAPRPATRHPEPDPWDRETAAYVHVPHDPDAACLPYC